MAQCKCQGLFPLPRSTPLHPLCQVHPVAIMPSDPSLPALESRLSRGEKAPWVWEDGLVHAESGLALECKVRGCGEPHTPVGKRKKKKWLFFQCNLSTQHPSPGPASQTEPIVLLEAEATLLLLQCLAFREGRRAKGQRCQCPSGLRMLGRPSGIHSSWQVRCISRAAQSRLPGLLRTSSHKTPELSHRDNPSRKLAGPFAAKAGAGVR